MANETHVPEDLEEQRHHELTPEAYEATVPGSLTGFRGLNNSTLIAIATGAVVIVIVTIVTILARFHGSGPDPTTASVASGSTPAAAANGLGNPDPNATPFVAEPAPYPTEMETAAPFAFPSPKAQRTPYVPNNAPANNETRPAYQQQPQWPSTTTAAEQNSGAGGRMSLEPPSTSGSQNDQAQADLQDPYQKVVYRPVYDRAGRMVMVVAVPVVSGQGNASVRPYQPQPYYASASGGREMALSPDYGGSPRTSSSSSYGSAPYAVDNTPAPSSQFVAQSGGSSDQGNGGGASQVAGQHGPTGQGQGYGNSQDEVGPIDPISAMQLDPTTVIPARLLSKIVSTLPGPVSAQVIQPVYDSATHSTIVIPAGSKLFGIYDNALVENQNRLMMAWTRIVFPNGREFQVGGQPGTDAQGAAGFSGDTDKHIGSVYTSAILLTVLAGAEAAISGGSQNQCYSLTNGTTVPQAIQCGAGTQLNSVANKVLDRSLNRQPTIIIRPPYEFQIFVTRDLPLDKYMVR